MFIYNFFNLSARCVVKMRLILSSFSGPHVKLTVGFKIFFIKTYFKFTIRSRKRTIKILSLIEST